MKNFAVLIVALLAGALNASAQVKVSIVLENEQFIANEALVAKVRISNDSGATLRLGEEPDWLTFVIETVEGPYVRNLRPPEVAGGFNLESSHTATKRVDIAPCFNLTQPGKYKLIATVKVPAFNATYASPGKTFFIVSGSTRWEKQFGVPTNLAPADANGLPEIRKYILVQATTGKETKLFARITDAHDINLRVVPIGTVISFSKPEPQLDKWSNLHIFYQTGARSFLYTVLNPEGLILARETHDISDTRPAMTTDEDGRILIRGGIRRRALDDIPPSEVVDDPPLALEEGRPTLPAQTNSDPGKKSKKTAGSVDAKDKKKQ